MWTRFIPSLLRAVIVTLRAYWRVARQVFHEAAGTLFALFALYGLMGAWRQWRWHRWQGEWQIAVALAFALAMTLFAVASFRSARRVR